MDASPLVSARDALVLQLCRVFTGPTAPAWRQVDDLMPQRLVGGLLQTAAAARTGRRNHFD
ncbi:MAG: hypothetical protein JW810_06500, partial [Sedimentisphaerales bacterium]|nr:hypothetical protein [Sedimentisphaerales bacterium]